MTARLRAGPADAHRSGSRHAGARHRGEGFIGSALVRELLDAGHPVVGLARNEDAGSRLARPGADAHCGDLTDHDALAAGARACDGVAGLAFVHDFSRFGDSIETDQRAGVAAYVGEGLNRWPAARRLDAARLLRLALERVAPGARLHGAAKEAAAQFGWMAPFVRPTRWRPARGSARWWVGGPGNGGCSPACGGGGHFG